MNRAHLAKRLFDEKYKNMIIDRYTKLPRWSWPSSAAYILDPRAKSEREILEYIYEKYPEGSHRKQIKKDILSLDYDKFWGAWAQLRIYDWMNSRGLELKPEPVVGKGKPDYLIKYPAGKNIFNELIMEVTAVNVEGRIKRGEEQRINHMLAKLSEIAVKTNYVYRIHIPACSLKYLSRINYNILQKNFTDQIENLRVHQNRQTTFICQTEDIKFEVEILAILKRKKGYIDRYLLGFEDEKEEKRKFIDRVYDKILRKVGKYKELKNFKKPFIIALFIKGPFFIVDFEKAFIKTIEVEKVAKILSYRNLSGILLYEIITHHEIDGSYSIHPIHTFYPYPNAKFPVDEYFIVLIDPLLGTDESKSIKEKILRGEITLS